MIEKLGITSETHDEVFCEMLEALIIFYIFIQNEGYMFEGKNTAQKLIEKATGRSWQEVKEIIGAN